MRRVPSPVTVVTAVGAGERRGITIGSFASVSLDPPLVSFNVGKDAQMHPVIEAADHFNVHVLTDTQGYLCNHFALPDTTPAQQFENVSFRLDAQGTPVLDAVLTVFFCKKYALYDAGDHTLVVGEVLRIEEAPEGQPILYFDRSYRSVGEEVRSSLFAPVKRASNDVP